MHELTINKRCKAAPSRIFAAWSSADMVKTWFAPGAMHVAEAQVDFRVGGTYRIVMERPDGQQHIVGGTYRAIEPDEHLAFTWSWEGSGVTTEVDVRLTPAGEQTELQLVHREIPTEESRASHSQGWEGCLAKLIELQ
jgi:uncharacterized protein YndB with AHSA1/START domain